MRLLTILRSWLAPPREGCRVSTCGEPPSASGLCVTHEVEWRRSPERREAGPGQEAQALSDFVRRVEVFDLGW